MSMNVWLRYFRGRDFQSACGPFWALLNRRHKRYCWNGSSQTYGLWLFVLLPFFRSVIAVTTLVACSVAASFASSSPPNAPILSVSDAGAESLKLNVAPVGDGGSAIESATVTCSLDDFEEPKAGGAYTINRASGAFSDSALEAPVTLALTDSDITKSLVRSYAESAEALQLMLVDSELGEITLNMSSYSPFASTVMFVVDETDQGSESLNHRRYFRGAIEGFSDSYAFLSLLPTGDFDVSYEVAGSSRQGRMRSGSFRLSEPISKAEQTPQLLNLDDVIEPEELIVPADSKQSRYVREEVIPVGPGRFLYEWPGYRAIYAIEVPAGQRHVGVISRGPASAGVVMAKDAPSYREINEAAEGVCRFNGRIEGSCVLEYPEPGTYYFYVYHFSSGPTQISVGFADEVKPYEGFKVPVVIDMDASLYTNFSSTDEALAYIASLFAYSNEVYEREVNTQLQIAGINARTQEDIGTQLSSIKAYYIENYPYLERALVAHLTREVSGGNAYIDDDALCGTRGYSVSGVSGNSPTLGAPITWDALVFMHEVGHNFNSPHTHSAGGLFGVAAPVDECTSGYLPGVNSLRGGAEGNFNGTIMSYCHMLKPGLVGNVASSFGKDHPYGVAAYRIPQNMLNQVTRQAAIAPSCVATYISQRVWSATVDADAGSGDDTFLVTLEDLPPRQTFNCRATVTNASGDSSPSDTAVVQTLGMLTVNASAGEGGSISPSGDQTVAPGSVISYTLTPNTGYEVGEVSGSCSPGSLSGNTYTTGQVTVDCTVRVIFQCSDLDYTFTNQADVDAFAATGCDSIPGDLYISGSFITNLDGLIKLTSVGGDLTIEHNGRLTNADGLASITNVGGSLKINGGNALNSLDGLAGITSIGGDLSIRSDIRLRNIDGLSSLTSVGNNLEIAFTEELPNVDGLRNLSSLGGRLELVGNDALVDVNGLVKLARVESVDIDRNNALTNLDGLIGLVDIERELEIRSNPVLRDVNGLASLTNIGGWVFVDNNPVLYGIDGFSNLRNLGSSIHVHRNDSLENLDGLAGLTWHSDNYLDIWKNRALSSIDGLANMTSVGSVRISGSSVSNLDALSNLKNVGYLEIGSQTGGNPALTNIDGLANLSSVGSSLLIRFNDALTNVDGLVNVRRVGGELRISDNDALRDLGGLVNLIDVEGDWLAVNDNQSLADCSALGKVLGAPTGPPNDSVGGQILIRDNAEGCKSIDQILRDGVMLPNAPAAPIINKTDYGDSEVILYVSVTDDGGSDVTEYVATCTDGENALTGSSASSPVTVSGLTNGVAYTCTVTAANSAGASSGSLVSDPTTPQEAFSGLPVWLLYLSTQQANNAPASSGGDGVTDSNEDCVQSTWSNCDSSSDATSPTGGDSDDADGDGVPDSNDACPNTLQGELVDASGCSDSQI